MPKSSLQIATVKITKPKRINNIRYTRTLKLSFQRTHTHTHNRHTQQLQRLEQKQPQVRSVEIFLRRAW